MLYTYNQYTGSRIIYQSNVYANAVKVYALIIVLCFGIKYIDL